MIPIINIELFVSPANGSLVGILITIGDVTDIFLIELDTGKDLVENLQNTLHKQFFSPL